MGFIIGKAGDLGQATGRLAELAAAIQRDLCQAGFYKRRST